MIARGAKPCDVCLHPWRRATGSDLMASAATRRAPMSTYDIVIKGGTVFDGLQTPRFKADIAIKYGRIAQIGRVDAAEGAEVIDAAGKHVAPGFVDLHTHYDSQVFWDP